jgi:CIC family chloride channel protein
MEPAVTIFPDDVCSTALAKFLSSGYSKLPVVSRSDPKKILGMLSHEDLTNAYNQELKRRRSAS